MNQVNLPPADRALLQIVAHALIFAIPVFHIANWMRKQSGLHAPIRLNPLSEINAEKFTQLINKISQCPATKELWRQVNREKKVGLLFSSFESIGRTAETNLADRTILIDRSASFPQALNGLLSQLTKLKKIKQVLNLNREVQEGNLSQQEFLKKGLALRYKIASSTHQIIASCNKAGSWKELEALRISQLPEWPFETAWNHYLTDPLYAKDRQMGAAIWQREGKEPFCAKQPTHADCN